MIDEYGDFHLTDTYTVMLIITDDDIDTNNIQTNTDTDIKNC